MIEKRGNIYNWTYPLQFMDKEEALTDGIISRVKRNYHIHEILFANPDGSGDYCLAYVTAAEIKIYVTADKRMYEFLESIQMGYKEFLGLPLIEQLWKMMSYYDLTKVLRDIEMSSMSFEEACSFAHIKIQ